MNVFSKTEKCYRFFLKLFFTSGLYRVARDSGQRYLISISHVLLRVFAESLEKGVCASIFASVMFREPVCHFSSTRMRILSKENYDGSDRPRRSSRTKKSTKFVI